MCFNHYFDLCYSIYDVIHYTILASIGYENHFDRNHQPGKV